MDNELQDKKLYSYKKALNQPYWIQKLNDKLSLDSPIKFSLVVYFLLVFVLLYSLLDIVIGSTDWLFGGL